MSQPNQQAVIELLGVLAYGELEAFDRIAQDALMAPDLAGREAMSALAVKEYGHFQKIVEYLRDSGADPAAAMQPFVGAVDSFHQSTAPSDYPEAMVKIYVGDGFAADFYREVAEYLDPTTRRLIDEVCGEYGQSEFLVPTVRSLIAADETLASRLSLWGRRLVGEALSQAQRVAAEHDAILELMVGRVDLAEVGRTLARLTDKHSERMGQLGLNA